MYARNWLCLNEQKGRHEEQYYNYIKSLRMKTLGRSVYVETLGRECNSISAIHLNIIRVASKT